MKEMVTEIFKKKRGKTE